MPHKLVGRTLGRTYRLERLLGSGGTGAVYVARHERTGGLCAVRVVSRALLDGADAFERFSDETRLIATLRHPHILSTTDMDWDDDSSLFIVTELLEGESLATRLQHRGSLPLSQGLELLRQVGSALHAAHRMGVLHRDLRPDSIFLCRSDLGDRVTETARVADFGLSRLRRAPREPGLYTAPEQAAGQGVDSRAEQWSLAAIVYRALAGHAPVAQEDGEGATPLLTLAPEVPAGVAAAIGRALSLRREDRFDTVLELVNAAVERPASRPLMMGLGRPAQLPGLGGGGPGSQSMKGAAPGSLSTKGAAPGSLSMKGAAPGSLSMKGAAPGSLSMKASIGASMRGDVPTEGLAGGGVRPTAAPRSMDGAAVPYAPSTRSPVMAGMVVPVADAKEPWSHGRTAVLAGLCTLLIGVTAAGLALRSAQRATQQVAVLQSASAAQPVLQSASAAQPVPAQPAADPGSGVGSQGTAVGSQGPAVGSQGPAVGSQGSAVGFQGTAVGSQGPAVGSQGTAVGSQGPAVGSQRPVANAPEPAPGPLSRGAGAAVVATEPPPEQDPGQLLSRAQVLYTDGARERALALGIRAAEARGPTELAAWRFVGATACGVRDLRAANRAYRHLGPEDREFLVPLCKRWGLELWEGRFHAASVVVTDSASPR